MSVILALVMAMGTVGQTTVPYHIMAEETPYVISAGRMVFASSFKDNNTPENAVDGSLSTRYESQWGVDPQWFYIDLGKVTQITGIKIDWKGAYAKEYKIQFSNDEESWTDVYTTTSSKGGNEELDITGNARYVRIYMTKRALTAYGYSFNEFEVYGLDGITKRPQDYGENIALGKNITASSIHVTDSMYDEEGNLNDSSVAARNAVDGNMTSKWVSNYADDQWLQVDLGVLYEIGRVMIYWANDSGKIYDIQVSEDGQQWNTVYRQLSGYSSELANIPVYVKARYVRMYGYTRVNTSNGFCINELQIYPYREGEEKKVYNIEDLPQLEVKNVEEGEGSYVTSAMYLEKAKIPVYKTEDVEVPIATNDWWQSAIMQKFGNLMCLMPLKAKYSTKGLGILSATEGWLPTPGETSVNFSVKSETLIDMYVLPDGFNANESYDRVSGYSDYTADIDLCDDNGVRMRTTFVKGSPYLFTRFEKTKTLYLSVPNLVKIFDDNGNETLKNGETLVTDHIGVMVTDNDNKDKTKTSTSYYCLCFPEGTILKNNSGTVKIILPEENGYMSVGSMLRETDLNLYYKHGYAFVTDTKVTYTYDDATAVIHTKYNVITQVMRQGFSNITMQCMLPHQWKKSEDDNRAIGTYTSVRGNMKCIVANEFSTKDRFYGLIPTFSMPSDSEFDTEILKGYLETLEGATSNLNPSSDAYWEGKNIHPLAMGVLMADQTGNAELRDIFLERLKKIMVNWFHYDGEDDKSFFIYDEHWGTLYYKQSEFGANTSIADHHFTYGYFMFGASVLANYDRDFYHSYKGMIEMLIRDYGNYAEDDKLFCRFRNYDLYEGHSWAGGYANNDSGNNQESASEALFSWVGMYLWGVVSGNDDYRDAGVFGFTNEIEAVKQYWFNYDKDNWVSDYPYQVVSQVYGGTNFFGTFFGGQPLYCYGINWLPVGEYLTYYGMDQERCAEIYQGLLNDTETAIRKSQLSAKNNGKTEEEIEAVRTNYKTPDNGWQHITWSYLSMTNPILALDKFQNNWSSVQKTDQANTYWYIHSMLESGCKTDEIYATGDISATVYYNSSTKKYTAMAWNPTDKGQSVDYYQGNKKIGTAYVNAHSQIRFEIPSQDNFVIHQTVAPKFQVKGFYDDSVEENVSGKVVYDDNRYVEITCEDQGAEIHYTVDGTTPTKDSPIYTEPIMVADNTVIKTYTCKEGYVDSAYQSLQIIIEGTEVTDSKNIALGKSVVVSSEEGKTTLGEYITDGNEKTRWSSKFTDEQWCYVDLGEIYPVNTVTINWQNSYAEEYEIQVSVDGEEWTTVASVSNHKSGIQTTTFDAINARYVKMQGIKRHSVYGYSIWEMEVNTATVAEPPTIHVEELRNGKNRITMSTPVKGAYIKYTLDGSDPNKDSLTYAGPIEVGEAVIKAVTHRKGMMRSGVVREKVLERPSEEPKTEEATTTVFIEDSTKVPVISQPTIKNEDVSSKTTKKVDKKINVRKAKIKRAKRNKTRKKVKINLKKLKGVTGYQIKISTSKKFKKKETRIKYFKKAKFTIAKLKKKKTYYIKVRAYVVQGRKKYFGTWSKRKRIK